MLVDLVSDSGKEMISKKERATQLCLLTIGTFQLVMMVMQKLYLSLDHLKVLLDFQLKGHEKFLLKFMKLFRQFDKDKNGVINEEEFRQLIIATDPKKNDSEIQDLLNMVDPHNNQQISFSECVNFLSSDLVHMTG